MVYRWVLILNAPATIEELLFITHHKAKVIAQVAVGEHWQLTIEQNEHDMSPADRNRYKRMRHTGTFLQ